jgi:hypothetical protein
LGIAQQSKEVKEKIKVDYLQSVSQVYSNVARVSIETSSSLEIILGAGRTSGEVKLDEDSAPELIDLQTRRFPLLGDRLAEQV